LRHARAAAAKNHDVQRQRGRRYTSRLYAVHHAPLQRHEQVRDTSGQTFDAVRKFVLPQHAEAIRVPRRAALNNSTKCPRALCCV